jgi:predicted DNA binding CopG/RHH family protein
MSDYIAGGKTCNTDTAIKLHEKWVDRGHGCTSGWILYQTKHGAFFLFVQPPQDPAESYLQPLSDDEALERCQNHAPNLVEQYFGDFPEAGAAERRWTIRIPENLARRVEAVAQEKGMPINRYVMRCLERNVVVDGHPRTDN